MRVLLAMGLAVMLSGCAALSDAFHPISTADVLPSVLADPATQPLPATAVCQLSDGTRAPSLEALLAGRDERLSVVALETRVAAVQKRLTQDLGAPTGLVSFITRSLSAAARGQRPPEQSVSSNELHDFARKVHDKLLEIMAADARDGADEARRFRHILISYLHAYVQGSYVDRFGNALDAPTLSMTIGDGEIAGVLTVLMDAIGDFILASPVWKDGDGAYYPASFIGGADDKAKAGDKASQDAKKKIVPTGAIEDKDNKTIIAVLKLEADGTSCGIDKTKAKAIEFLAQTAGLRAAAASGLIGGSFGGVGVSLGAFGKISIGDNKTLQTIVKTAFYKLAERVAYEATYRTLYPLTIETDTDFATLIEQYIDKELKKHGPKA